MTDGELRQKDYMTYPRSKSKPVERLELKPYPQHPFKAITKKPIFQRILLLFISFAEEPKDICKYPRDLSF